MSQSARKLFIILLSATFVGCASENKKLLTDKMNMQTSVHSRADLRQAANESIAASPQLTPVQKQMLTDLRISISNQSDEVDQQALNLKSQLLKDIMAEKYDVTEVRLIKDQMRALEDKRINMIFSAIDQSNEIIGRDLPKNQHMMREFIGDYSVR
jgi:uncharacterized protein YcfL